MEQSLKDLKQVMIAGSGTLGLRIGLQCALSGYETTIFDIHASAFDRARLAQEHILKDLKKRKVISSAEASEAQNRISWTTDLKLAAGKADFVSESVKEDVEIKKKVWTEIGSHCPRHAVLTTNTSSFLPSMFADASGNPGNFCAFHFHDVFYSNVVDVMPHPNTDAWVNTYLKELAYKLKQVPVMIQKETPGYVFNNLLGVILDTAGLLVADGKASIQDVDRSWMGNMKTRSGPFGMLDAIGLDTAWHVSVAKKDKVSRRFSAFLETYIEQGKLGVKTGEGFYKYPNPEYKSADFLKG